MRHGTRQLSGERTRHGAWHPATGLVLRRRVAGFVSAVDRRMLRFRNGLQIGVSVLVLTVIPGSV